MNYIAQQLNSFAYYKKIFVLSFFFFFIISFCTLCLKIKTTIIIKRLCNVYNIYIYIHRTSILFNYLRIYFEYIILHVYTNIIYNIYIIFIFLQLCFFSPLFLRDFITESSYEITGYH